MGQNDAATIDRAAPPFDRLTTVQRLAADRSGHRSEFARHQLYVGRDRKTRTQVLVKLTSKPGLVYQQDLTNEIATLTTVNRGLPLSRYFPELHDHGQLPDGRTYLVISLFDELPLVTSVGSERMPARLVGHLRTAIEVASALVDLHGLQIFHVDLNPMNILFRPEKGRPIVRIVDFESSYEVARHSNGVFYSPPTTPGYCAPELARQAPDARADLFSLGAVLYAMLAGHQWTRDTDVCARVEHDRELDPELRELLRTAVATDPDRRYQSATEFHGVLSAYLEQIWPGRA